MPKNPSNLFPPFSFSPQFSIFTRLNFSSDFIFPATKPATLIFFSHKIQIFQFSFPPQFSIFSLRPWFFPSNFQFCPLDGIRTWDLSYTTLKSKGLNPSYDTNFFDMSENLLIFPTVYCASNQAKSLSPHPV